MQNENLPSEIVRPLKIAAIAITIFIGFSCAWAVFAPLSTTLHLSGKIISSRPTIELQHPYGGLVSEASIARHDQVAEGQVLFRIDTSLEEEQLATLTRTMDIYLSENRVIEQLLKTADETDTPLVQEQDSPYFHSHEQAILQAHLQRQTTAFLTEQASALSHKISLTTQQLRLMRGRQDRQADLTGKGLISLSDEEILKERVLIVQSEIEEDRASLASLRGQIASSEGKADLAMLSLREGFLRTRDENTKQLEDIQRQIAELRDRIKQSVVRSPIDGAVAELHFEATGMYAARGTTLISLTQPLEQPLVSFQVSVGQIDQLRTGMKGRLILTSLPQRTMPRIDLEIIAISPRAAEDENGHPVSYNGMARILPHSMKRLQASLGAVKLTEDMPVQLMIDARQTTLASYIFEPLIAAFHKSFQD